MNLWISLRPGWQLQDVQAGLSIVLAVLFTTGIFAFVRYCWQTAAARIVHHKNVPLSSLLSLNTVGEAWDVIWLLKRDVFAPHYLKLLLQCVVMFTLTAATLFSGPLARYSTRWGFVVAEREINGTQAERITTGLIYADVDWNQTQYNLDRANFPYDQLPEYLPDQNTRWVYNPTQWNDTWSMQCEYTNETKVTIRDTGNCRTVSSEWDGLDEIWKDESDFSDWRMDSSGWFSNSTNWKDIQYFFHGVNWTTWNTSMSTYTDMLMSTASIIFHDVAKVNNDSSNCIFQPGTYPARYTKVACRLRRQSDIAVPEYGAYPDTPEVQAVAGAYTAHYAQRLRVMSSRELTVPSVPPEELLRYYQAYHIVKDTATGPFNVRRMDVEVRVVKLSAICLGLSVAAGVIELTGIIWYAMFTYRHWEYFIKTPQSKLDWMLQTIQATAGNRDMARAQFRQSMTNTPDPQEDTLPLRPMKAGNSTVLNVNTAYDSSINDTSFHHSTQHEPYTHTQKDGFESVEWRNRAPEVPGERLGSSHPYPGDTHNHGHNNPFSTGFSHVSAAAASVFGMDSHSPGARGGRSAYEPLASPPVPQDPTHGYGHAGSGVSSTYYPDYAAGGNGGGGLSRGADEGTYPSVQPIEDGSFQGRQGWPR